MLDILHIAHVSSYINVVLNLTTCIVKDRESRSTFDMQRIHVYTDQVIDGIGLALTVHTK